MPSCASAANCGRFNEAGAINAGKPLGQIVEGAGRVCFNEAGAINAGKRSGIWRSGRARWSLQ